MKLEDSLNKYLVSTSATGDTILFMRPVPPSLPRGEALVLAAWIVALADRGEFPLILSTVRDT